MVEKYTLEILMNYSIDTQGGKPLLDIVDQNLILNEVQEDKLQQLIKPFIDSFETDLNSNDQKF